MIFPRSASNFSEAGPCERAPSLADNREKMYFPPCQRVRHFWLVIIMVVDAADPSLVARVVEHQLRNVRFDPDLPHAGPHRAAKIMNMPGHQCAAAVRLAD